MPGKGAGFVSARNAGAPVGVGPRCLSKYQTQHAGVTVDTGKELRRCLKILGFSRLDYHGIS